MAVRYWEIRVSGWEKIQTVCGEEMTADEAIEMTGAKPDDCWTPTEVSKAWYAQTQRYNSKRNNR
jgi:hypothetical protein